MFVWKCSGFISNVPLISGTFCVCEVGSLAGFASVSIQNPDCADPVTLQGQMSCSEEASGLHAHDGSLQQGEEMQISAVTFLLL